MATEAPSAPATPAAAPASAPSPTPQPNLSQPSFAGKPIQPKPAMKGMFERMRGKLNVPSDPAPAAPEPPQKPESAPESPDPEPSDEPTPEPATAPTDDPKPATAKAPADKKPAKTNPWNLVNEYKKKLAAAESDLAKLKLSGVAPEKEKDYQDRLSASEKRIKDYEDEIRFTRYEKSEEFKTKYLEPYNKAWERATKELSEITVTDANGERGAQPSDLLELVNLPLGAARARAKEVFGEFADDVMAHRKTVRDLFDQQTSALEDAKKNGAKRETEFREKQTRWLSETKDSIAKAWNSSNEAAINHPNDGAFFKQAEGDDTRNQILGKGFALVDKAFAENPMDPKWTAEERAAIVRRHATVRNRAAAFGVLKLLNQRLIAELAELKKANGELADSEPTTGAPVKNGNTTPVAINKSKQDQMKDRLRARWAKAG